MHELTLIAPPPLNENLLKDAARLSIESKVLNVKHDAAMIMHHHLYKSG